MRVRLDYHRDGLEVEVPDRNLAQVLRLKAAAPVEDPAGAVAEALRKPIGAAPLRELARGRRSACVVISDVTRPVPNPVLLPALLEEIERGGIDRDRILILVGTGLHRPNLGDELRSVVGDVVFGRYRIENHAARDPAAHRDLGSTAQGITVRVDARFLDADLKVVTGLIEPHFMAGFSGGRKGVCPGVCAAETICAFHSPEMIEHPRARAGVLEGNPVHEASLEAARRAGVDFILNVVLDEERRVLGVFGGELEAAFGAGVERARSVCTAEVESPADIVVTTGAGYPLDTTWYQAIKGAVVCLPAVRPGGTIILAAGMREGLGGPEFTRLCRETKDLEDFMRRVREPGCFRLDQWELEEFVLARRHARVMVYTDGLDAATRQMLHAEPVPSVEDGIARCLERHGPAAKVIVIPRGPYVLPAPRGSSDL